MPADAVKTAFYEGVDSLKTIGIDRSRGEIESRLESLEVQASGGLQVESRRAQLALREQSERHQVESRMDRVLQ